MNVLKELSRYDKNVLPNGARLLVRQESAPYATFRVRIGYGHCHDPPELDGTAHFAEHMFFRSNSQYPTDEITSELQRLTGMDPNALTSDEEIFTEHYLMPLENLGKVMDIIASGIHNPHVKPEEFEKERATILNELREVGVFQRYVQEVVKRELYPNHPYGCRFGCNVESITALNSEQLDQTRNTYFTGPNLIVVLAGDIRDQDVKRTEELFGTKNSKAAPELPEVRPLDEDVLLMQRFADVPGVNKPLHSVYWTFQLKPGKEGITLDILSDYLGSSTNSILARRLREKMGVVYSVVAGISTLNKINDFVISAIGFQQDAISTISRVTEEELERIKQGEIDTDYLELRKHMRILNYPRRFKTVEQRANWMLDREVRELVFDHQEYIDVVKSITPNDLVTVARKYLNGHKLTFVALLN